MISKKPSEILALPLPEPTAAAKPPRPVDMDRLSKLSKPKPKAEDPSIRTSVPKPKKLTRINSKSRLLQKRARRLQEKRRSNSNEPILALTTG